jgi:multiple sugar transport system ATP-binding protein
VTAFGLELEHVSKRYAGAPVVDDVSLQVAEGEMLVLVGPSGSGKSTLLRLIAGLVPHDSGSIVIAGRDVGALPPAERDIAMVFQSYALFPHMTILENLSFGLKARGVKRAQVDTQAAQVAAVLALTPLLRRYPRELSGGERQRVALGRAMLREPKLFLMDEPLSNLDAQLRVHTRAEIVRLHARLRTTTVYVTHDQVEALSMGDRIGVLHQGRLVQLGTPSDVYRWPESLFVARFIGTPPMNVFDVTALPPGCVRWNDSTVCVPARLHAAVERGGRELMLGVRPEHVYVEGSRWARTNQTGPMIPATVDIVELAGDQIFLELRIAETLLVARAEPDLRIPAGNRVNVWFDTDALHLFDPISEAALGGEAVA